MTNSDLSRIINSDEVQSVVNAPKTGTPAAVPKVNPFNATSAGKAALEKLNPAGASLKRKRSEEQAAAVKAKASKKKPTKMDPAVTKAKKAYYNSMVADC